MSENEEDMLITMLNSEDIDLALAIVNKMDSNMSILNKLISEENYQDCLWYKSALVRDRAHFFRKDLKGTRPLIFNRGENE